MLDQLAGEIPVIEYKTGGFNRSKLTLSERERFGPLLGRRCSQKDTCRSFTLIPRVPMGPGRGIPLFQIRAPCPVSLAPLSLTENGGLSL